MTVTVQGSSPATLGAEKHDLNTDLMRLKTADLRGAIGVGSRVGEGARPRQGGRKQHVGSQRARVRARARAEPSRVWHIVC